MSQCLRLKNDGKQCLRLASKKHGSQSQFCWQHQKFQSIVPLSVSPRTKIQLKASFSECIPQPICLIDPIFASSEPLIDNRCANQTWSSGLKEPLIVTEKSSEPVLMTSDTSEPLDLLGRLSKISIPSGSQKSRAISQLLGPDRLIFFPNIKGKKILLIGEKPNQHYQSNIDSVDQWLLNLSKSAPEPLDLFIESSHQSSMELSGRIRFHSIDVRKYLSGNVYLLDPFQMMIIKLIVLQPEMSWNQAEKRLRKAFCDVSQKYQKHRKSIVSYLCGFNRSHLFLTIIVNFLNEIAQLIKVPIDSQDFNKYLNVYFKNIDKEISKINHSIDKKKFLTTLIQTSLDVRFDSIMYLPLNIYFLSKFLLIFNTESSAKKLHKESKNAIIYGDSQSIDFYSKFLIKYSASTPLFSIQNKNSQYLRLDQPFDLFL